MAWFPTPGRTSKKVNISVKIVVASLVFEGGSRNRDTVFLRSRSSTTFMSSNDFIIVSWGGVT